jgi:mannose-6-phosphate isomerase
MNPPLPPLKFTPVIKPLPWGGRKLEALFGKVLPASVPCGESWEVVDLPQEQSVVSEGPLAALSLSELIRRFPDQVLGEAPLLQGRFPVLFKLIDARQTLSVQVHPDEQACARFGQGARPKTEAWYVLQTEPGACIYLGLKPGAGERELRGALEQGTLGDLLQPVEVRTGDFLFLPAGTLHAIGGGVLLAEIQQSSDTTYRLYDWGRVGLDGRPRPLHLPEALGSIAYEQRGRPAHATPLSGRPGIRCRAFTFERVGLAPGGSLLLEAGRPRLLCCIEGAGTIGDTGLQPMPLRLGETCLVPAGRAGQAESVGGGTFLLVRV